MAAAAPWSAEPDDDEATLEPSLPWVARGGWRRAAVGGAVGFVAGLLVVRWVDRGTAHQERSDA